MHRCCVWSLFTLGILFVLCFDTANTLECFQCHSTIDRRSDSCLLGAPLKSLGRETCPDNAPNICLVVQYETRHPHQSPVYDTTRRCMSAIEAANLCRTNGTAHNGRLMRKCNTCRTSHCNLSNILRPNHILSIQSIIVLYIVILYLY